MYVCMYVRMYKQLNASSSAAQNRDAKAYDGPGNYGAANICVCVCMHVCMNSEMHLQMCFCVCVCVYVCIYV